MLNFPSSPTLNEEYIYNNRTWVWNGVGWALKPVSLTSGNTANGVAYLDGSKVLTTGSALTFDGTNLAVTNKLGVGGITSPTYAVDVGDSASGNMFRFSRSGTELGSFISGGTPFFGALSNHPLVFVTNATEQMCLTSTGLGIGTTSPSSPLTISKSSATAVEISSGATYPVNAYGATTGATTFAIANTGGTSYFGNENSAGGNLFSGTAAYATVLGTGSARSLQFATNNSVRTTIDSSGNLGVGTTSLNKTAIDRTLTVNGSANAGLELAAGDVCYGLIFANSSRFSLDTNNSGANIINFYTSATERARIDSSGNLLVGTTSGSYHIFQKNLSGNYAAEVTNSSSSAPYALNLALSGVTGGAGGGFLTCADNANRLLIAGNGNVTNVNGSYGAISDAKLKENVVEATPKLGKLNQVRIVNFNIIGDKQKQIGVIAQELEQVFPGMVEETSDTDKEGNDLGTTTKSVKYSVFVPMLIKAIQEQQAIITALTARVEALESN